MGEDARYHCQQCHWESNGDETTERAKAAINHYINTGHTVVATTSESRSTPAVHDATR